MYLSPRLQSEIERSLRTRFATRLFAGAVLDNRPPRWSAEDALANMAAIEALLESARTGVIVPVAR